MRWVAIVLALTGNLYCQTRTKPSSIIQDADVSIELRVIPQAEFTLPDITDVAHKFLESTAASHKMAVLIAYDNSDVAAHEAGNCEGSYRQWRLLYDQFPKVPLVAAQVMSLGQDAALCLRTPEGTVQHLVLRGADATHFSFEGNRFEILYATGRIRSTFEGCSPGAVDPIFYLRTTAILGTGLCERVTLWLAARLGKSHVQVSFANGQWFPCDGRFPLIYPFRPAEPAPSSDDFYALTGYSCLVSCDGKPICLASTIPRPSQGDPAQ